MVYRVSFTKSRKQPSAALDRKLAIGIVTGKIFVEQRSAASEVWDYQVIEDRAREFEQTLQNSELVVRYDIVDLELTSRDDDIRNF
jgi:hypothetical protein